MLSADRRPKVTLLQVHCENWRKTRCLTQVCSWSSSEKAELLEQHQEVKASGDGAPMANGALAENVVNVLLNFEIQEVGSSSPSNKQQVQV